MPADKRENRPGDLTAWREDYRRGWAVAGRELRSTDAADSDAWLAGYSDRAAGRPQWHSLHCDQPTHGACTPRSAAERGDDDAAE
jgi:hypothetical protein